jgi:hypothetical protein
VFVGFGRADGLKSGTEAVMFFPNHQKLSDMQAQLDDVGRGRRDWGVRSCVEDVAKERGIGVERLRGQVGSELRGGRGVFVAVG